MNLIAKLGLDGKGFEAGLNKAQSKAQIFGAKVTSSLRAQFAGVFAGAAVVSMVKETVEWGSSLQNLSHKTGISTQALQRFEYAAKQTGAELSDVERFIENIAKAQYEASRGMKTYVDAFQVFGLSVETLKTMRPEQIFAHLADKFNVMEFEQAFGALQALGGGAAKNLAVAFAEGFAQIGNSFTPVGDEIIDTLDEIADKMVEIKEKAKGAFATAVSYVWERGRDVWDFLKVGVGGYSVMAGALLGGASPEEAAKQYDDFLADILDPRIEKKRRYARGGRQPRQPFAFTGFVPPALKAPSAAERIQSDKLAAIGGSVGVLQDRAQRIMRDQLMHLKAIDASTKQMATEKKETIEL